MDSGLAAVIGALTGAAASVVVVLIDRVVGVFQGRAERRRADRLELRTALLELNKALVALGARQAREGNDLPLRVNDAMSTLELLIAHDDRKLMAVASNVARMALVDDPQAAAALVAFRDLSSQWYRGRISARLVLERFKARGFPMD